jgi:hypothetical protein
MKPFASAGNFFDQEHHSVPIIGQHADRDLQLTLFQRSASSLKKQMKRYSGLNYGRIRTGKADYRRGTYVGMRRAVENFVGIAGNREAQSLNR